MTGYLQAVAGILVAVVLTLLMQQQGKSIAALLAMAVCVMVLVLGGEYLRPVLNFAQSLENLGGLDGDMIKVLLKTVGISMVSEVAVLVCNDSGNQSMGKALQILTSAVLLWMSLPAFQALMDLLAGILEGI